MNYFHSYEIPNDNNWYDAYSDAFGFAWIDEFKGCKTIQWLNSFSEGRHMSLSRRGKEPYVKKKNLPFIVASNYSIRDCFSKADFIVVKALQRRFLEVEIPLGERIDIEFDWDESDEDTVECWSDPEPEECSELEEFRMNNQELNQELIVTENESDNIFKQFINNKN